MTSLNLYGEAVKLALTTASGRSAALIPNTRYNVRAHGLGANVVWILQGDSSVAAALGTAGEFALSGGDALAECEITVREGGTYLAGIMSAGTGTLIITPIL